MTLEALLLLLMRALPLSFASAVIARKHYLTHKIEEIAMREDIDDQAKRDLIHELYTESELEQIQIKKKTNVLIS